VHATTRIANVLYYYIERIKIPTRVFAQAKILAFLLLLLLLLLLLVKQFYKSLSSVT